MSPKTGSSTAKNSEKKPRGKGKPFQKNDPITGEIDKRINREGIRHFDDVRHMVKGLFNEYLEVNEDEKTKPMRQIEFVFRSWILSDDYQKQRTALEYGVGKVPDEIKYGFDIDDFMLKNLDIFTDGQLQRIRAGEDPLAILAELIRESLANKKK